MRVDLVLIQQKENIHKNVIDEPVWVSFCQPCTENSEPRRHEKLSVDVEEMESVRTFQEDCGVIFLDSVAVSSVGSE